MRNLGNVAKVLLITVVAVVIGPSAGLAAALDEANKAPIHSADVTRQP